MNFYQGKWAALCLGLLVICLQTAAAQDRETRAVRPDEANPAGAKVETSGDEFSGSLFANAPEKTNDADFRGARDLAFRFPARTSFAETRFRFGSVEKAKRRFDFDALSSGREKSFAPADDGAASSRGDGEPRYVRETAPGRGFNYTGAFKQSLLFLGVQHGYAVAGQAKTRRALKHGPFFKDYFDSVKSLHGWDDGGRFFTNYIAHPMQGALTGQIYVQNSPQALREQFSMSRKYWGTRMKAMLWTTAWSTQFEIGPVSQASIGNVGLKGKQTWEDIVVTPTLGTAMLISEDALDRYLIKAIERNTTNRYVKIFARMLLNPTRNFSNLLRFREPWYRDRPSAR